MLELQFDKYLKSHIAAKPSIKKNYKKGLKKYTNKEGKNYKLRSNVSKLCHILPTLCC